MLLCLSPLILTHFWPTSTLLRGHLALATLSPPETDPQILERGGCAHEVLLGKYIRKILVSNFSVTCNSFCEFYTFGLISACLSSSVRLTTTSAAPCPERHNPIVVYSMICTQQVRDLTHDGCHDLQRVAPFDHAAHASSTWLLHFCHHSFWIFY